MSTQHPSRRPAAAIVAVLVVLAGLGGLLPPPSVHGEEGAPDHLVISEVVTGGASASDELVELYNPTAAGLPLEGLELLYVTASGAIVSRRVAWAVGAPEIPPAAHYLVANEAGAYAAIADATYASGMAASGGSVALRIAGAESAIDAVGWGTAASSWMEGTAAPPPAVGGSIERLPGGDAGSTTDTDDNAADFVLRELPGPQNSGSAPTPAPGASPTIGPSPSPSPSATPAPTSVATASPTLGPSVTPSPSPAPSAADVLTVAAARAAPDGARVTVEAVALTGSGFTEGGGYVADVTAGIAVIVTDSGFARGDRLRLTGTVDDRFAQRTLRVAAADVAILGAGTDPEAAASTTGAVGEALEGRLVVIEGTVLGAPTTLASGLAFDVDDGSGSVRVLVGAATGIDTTAWARGATLRTAGVVGQRDSSGSGTAGYRLQPRDPADVGSVGGPSPSPTAPASGTPHPSPSPSASPSASPSPTLAPGAGVIPIAEARAAAKNARLRVRGVVTLPPGIVDPTTAVIQDASGAIVLRLGEEAGAVRRGALVEVDGTRSTKAGMETLRVTTPVRDLGAAAEPAARAVRTGQAGEDDEAALVVARGALVAGARRSSAGSVTFEIDDGSGPLRVHLGAALAADHASLAAGTWVEVHGVLGQETIGSQPLRGYRVWPRESSELEVLATPTDAPGAGAATTGGASVTAATGTAPDAGSSLGDVEVGVAAGALRVGATLVAGPWPELGVGGLVWDGIEVAALGPDDAPRVVALLAGRRPPLAVALEAPRRSGQRVEGLSVIGLGDGAEALLATAARPHPPSAASPGPGGPTRWVSLVGRLSGGPRGDERLVAPGIEALVVDRRCADRELSPAGTVGIVGFVTGERPLRLVAPCGAVTAAPSLSRGLGAVPATTDDRDDGLLAGFPARPVAAEDPTTAPAAALVLAAAATLLAGAGWWRRTRSADGAAEPAAAAAPATDVPTTADDPDPHPGSGPPVLALVPKHRERGP